MQGGDVENEESQAREKIWGIQNGVFWSRPNGQPPICNIDVTVNRRLLVLYRYWAECCLDEWPRKVM